MRTNNPILRLAASIGVCYSLACHKSTVPGKETDNFNEDTSLAFLRRRYANCRFKKMVALQKIDYGQETNNAPQRF